MGKGADYMGGFLRVKVREDQCYSLGMFVLYEVYKMNRICSSDKIKRLGLQAGCQPVNDIDSFLGPEGPFKDFPCVIDAAVYDKVLGHHQFLEFHQDLVPFFGLDLIDPG